MRPDGKTLSMRRPALAPAAARPGSSPSLDPALRPCGLTSISRTVFAVSSALRSQLAGRPLGPFQRTLWLCAPARSTDRGARTRQLLTLVTPWSELPCGWLDLVNAHCVLAPWSSLVATQRARETTSLELSRDEYVAFACWLAEFLAPMRIRVNWGPPRSTACGAASDGNTTSAATARRAAAGAAACSSFVPDRPGRRASPGADAPDPRDVQR